MKLKFGKQERIFPDFEIETYGMEYVIKKALYLRQTDYTRVCI